MAINKAGHQNGLTPCLLVVGSMKIQLIHKMSSLQGESQERTQFIPPCALVKLVLPLVFGQAATQVIRWT